MRYGFGENKVLHDTSRITIIGIMVPWIVLAQAINKRTEFDIPLVKLSIVQPKNDSESKQVRITIHDDDYALISECNDMHVKNSRQGQERITYAELPANAFGLTGFEAEQYARVLSSLIATLEIFESDLAKERWDRCLFLDAYFPRFIKGFYSLSCAVFNSSSALPPETDISERLFDVSLQSVKSDQRVSRWREKKDYVVKLRIVVKELIYQLKTWQKKDLDNYKKDPFISFSDDLNDTYSLFVRMYFNLY
jgi:hypothetical protein